MLLNYFKIALRLLVKNKLFTVVNLVSLSTGLASIMTLAILVYQNMTRDHIFNDLGQMYYLKTYNPDGGSYMQTTYPLLGEMVKQCPELEGATHIQSWYYPWLKSGDKEFQETTSFVDTGFFKVFPFPFKYGNPQSALKDMYSVVLSEEIARKFFGNENPVGKLIACDDTLTLTVRGVLNEIPTNSTIRPSILLPTALLEANPDFKSSADWYNSFAENYIRIKKGSGPKKLDSRIESIVKLNYQNENKKNRVLAIPFSSIGDENDQTNLTIIKGSIGAAIFILLIILVNLINLNAATMYSRAKEVAVRQMIGGTKRNIVIQFCIENGLIVFSSLVLAWILFTLLLLPQVNGILKDKFGEISTRIEKDYPLIILFTGLGLILSVLAASLPAWKLAALKIVDTVKGKLSFGNFSTHAVRNTFITIQFVLAITLICVTIILNRQVKFMKVASLGFSKDNVAVANMDMAWRDPKAAGAHFQSILDQLRKNPHVRGVSTNFIVPTAYWDNFNTYYDPESNKEVHLRKAGADAGYFTTYEVQFVQGRNFDDALGATDKGGVILNQAAVKALGWSNAIGKHLRQKGSDTQTYTVIGVTNDFQYGSLQNPVGPLIHEYNGKASIDYKWLSVRTDPGHIRPIMDQLEQGFKTIPSRRDFSYQMMSDKVDNQYALLTGILKVTNYIAILTILIASMGMFGLIALFSKQRVKEIGIRKVLGASESSIVKLLSRDFILLVGLAMLIATPLAYYIMSNWLKDFNYKIQIQWWMFAIAGLLAIIIAMLTLSLQALKAAYAKPVNSLRSE
ncbi:MAG: ABC transporter permease [Chitinophagales bacterium]